MTARVPLVSVVIPTYNRSSLIINSIMSVINQDYPAIELIVVDDCSTDETCSVIEGLNNKKIRLIRHDSNRGAPAARNTGVRYANGDYIAFLDSDDAWAPNKISLQVALMQGSPDNVVLVYTGMEKIDGNGEIRGYKVPTLRGDLYLDLLRDNIVGSTSTPLLKIEAVREVGGFDERFRSRQDYDLWLRLGKKYHFDFLADPLVVYRIHNERISSSIETKIQGSQLFLEKYYDDIKKYPEILAYHYYNLGWLFMKKKEPKIARSYFKNSLQNTINIKSLVRYIQTFYQ